MQKENNHVISTDKKIHKIQHPFMKNKTKNDEQTNNR